MHGVIPYVIKRLAWAPLILFIVSIVTFSLGRFGPGDPARIIAGQNPDPIAIERIREERGLNDHFVVQYGNYMINALQADFGESMLYRGQDIKDVVFPRLWVTIQYNMIAVVLIFALGIPAGIWMARYQGTWKDPVSMSGLLLFAAIPVLIMVPILQYIFALQLNWLPTGGWETKEFFGWLELGIFSDTIIMPTIALTLPGIAGVARLMRSQVLEVMDQDYVRTAQAKGLNEKTVMIRHVARNAMLPISTVMGFALIGLLSGSIFLETLLGIPGIGFYAFEAVGSRDYDGIMAIVLIGASAFIVANVIIDITYSFIDPRIRLGEEASK